MKDAQLGFNTNVVYRGQTLHIQTEDSGRGRPHVITHLYSEGTILATKRTSYEECCGAEDVRERVRGLMKAQHKAMILELRAGAHDAAIRRMLEGGESPTEGESPPEEPPVPAPPEVAAASVVPPPGGSVIPPREALPPPVPPPTGPHPIATPLRGRQSTSYRPPSPSPGEPDVVPLAGETPSTPPTGRGRRRSGGIRPAVHREREGFGKDLITDRSLDEVVLSYLAEELTKDEK